MLGRHDFMRGMQALEGENNLRSEFNKKGDLDSKAIYWLILEDKERVKSIFDK